MVGQAVGLTGAQVHDVDVGIAALGLAEQDGLAIPGEAGREGHAGEVAEQFLAAGLDIEEIDARLAAFIRHIGDFLRRGGEARGQHSGAAGGEVLLVGAVRIHDGQALDARGLRAGFGDIDDAGVEIGVFAGQAGIDRVGDLVGDAAPVLGRGREAAAGLAVDAHQLAAIDVPEAEGDGDLAVGHFLESADDEALGADDLPVGKARLGIDRQIALDEGGRVLQVEQAGGGEVGADDFGDLLGEIGIGAGDLEVRDGNGGRLEVAFVDPHAQLR